MKSRVILLSVLVMCMVIGMCVAEQTMKDIDALIRQNEAKLKALEAIKTYADKNKLTRLTGGHIDELSTLY